MSEKIICIDPGHGGKDPGAVGVRGLREKDVVLIVAKALRNKLKAVPGVRVVMTRETDVFVELSERAAIANRAKADVFLSIHCNSAPTPAVGIETWIAPKTSVSFPLGEAIQDALTAEFPDKPDRGLKRAAFTVLTRTDMAAALAELEFLHTPCGEDRLGDAGRQLRCAEALMQGLLAFLEIGLPPARPVDPPEPVTCTVCDFADQVRHYGKRLMELADKMS